MAKKRTATRDTKLDLTEPAELSDDAQTSSPHCEKSGRPLVLNGASTLFYRCASCSRLGVKCTASVLNAQIKKEIEARGGSIVEALKEVLVGASA